MRALADFAKPRWRWLAQKGLLVWIGEKPRGFLSWVVLPHRGMSHEYTKELVALAPVLMRRASRLANNQAEAEDMVQDTLLKLYQRLENGADIQDLRAYGMRTLSNRAQRYWRARFGDTLEEDMASIDPDAPLRLDCADALAAIAQLPAHQREIMQWVVDGETSPQILSDRTGLPVGTIMSRLARARAKLRILLHEDNA